MRGYRTRAKSFLASSTPLLPYAFPRHPFCRSRIVHDLRGGIEAHGRPAAEIVLRPRAVSIGGKGHPGGVHGVGERSRRVGTQKRISPVGKRVEDEGDLEPMARTEAS